MKYSRKRTYRRKRLSRKRRTMNISRPRMSRTPSFNVTRTFWHFNWAPNTATTGGFWQYQQINLGNVPNVSEYVSVFDTYRVNSIKYTFRPRYDSFAGNDTTDTTLPGVTNQGGSDVHVIVDPKSTTNPSGTYTTANLNAFLENGKVRTYSGNKPFSFLIKYPCVLDDINGVAATNLRKAPFLSTKNTTINHRGAHVFISDVNLTGNFGNSWDVFVTLNMTFKGQA